jgi:hypothetical protein
VAVGEVASGYTETYVWPYVLGRQEKSRSCTLDWQEAGVDTTMRIKGSRDHAILLS